ncbi:MAG: UbiA family prenyltransferase [Syntrophorhabdaceae bacterium]|nr:UbiA family prenyltransferase [Syntrophorhabdaceae bacterium]
MSTAQPRTNQPVMLQARLFLALSRTPHGIIDLATPVLAAMMCLGGFPPARVLWLGILTAFAGYTSVYALNDLVDYQTDRKRFEKNLLSGGPDDLDSIFLRHPIASGDLSPGRALVWTIFWGLAALAGALALNPFCVVIFVAACLLEIVYCLAWQRSCLKVFVSGAVKTAGPVAAVYAVDPQPSYHFLVLLFFWLFFWEVGGQNVPNDWADVEEDREIHASTFPVLYGSAFTANVMLISLGLTVCLGVVTVIHSRLPYALTVAAASVAAGVWFLLLPAFRLYARRDRDAALELFNRSSYYPAAMLVIVILGSLI